MTGESSTEVPTGHGVSSRLRTMLARLAAGSSEGAARGIALLFGAFSLIDGVASYAAGRAPGLWWVDMRALPTAVSAILGTACATALLAYGLAPRMKPWRKRLTAAAGVTLAIVATANSITFNRLLASGAILSAPPVPLSAVLAVAFAFVAVRAWVSSSEARSAWDHAAAAVALVVAVTLFPLAQAFFFGSTDYSRPADAAVVFGAKVHTGGALSTSLENRVRTAVELYRQGTVRNLVMSGAVGASGIDEAAAMRSRAVALGVPGAAIITDDKGVNTDATVSDTVAQFREHGFGRVIAVSDFYHLPRVKLAYLAAGWDVATVPARQYRPVVTTPLFLAREIPGFWEYWLRAVARQVVHGGSPDRPNP